MGKSRYWAALVIPANIKDAAVNYLTRNGIPGDNFSARPVILEGDDDEADPRGYAAILRVDDGGKAAIERGADLNENAFAYVSMGKDEAKQAALDYIRSRGYRLRPKYWMALVVVAALKDEALAYLSGKGITPTQTRALIRQDDPDDAPARGYAAMITADQYMAFEIWKLTNRMQGAWGFADTNKSSSQANALAFIERKGYRIKP